MFLRYKKSFKLILNHYYHTNSKVMSSVDFEIPNYQIDYLAAKGLIHITPYTNGDPNCRITISDKGLIFFDELRDKRLRFWLPFSLSVIALLRPEIIKLIKLVLKRITT